MWRRFLFVIMSIWETGWKKTIYGAVLRGWRLFGQAFTILWRPWLPTSALRRDMRSNTNRYTKETIQLAKLLNVSTGGETLAIYNTPWRFARESTSTLSYRITEWGFATRPRTLRFPGEFYNKMDVFVLWRTIHYVNVRLFFLLWENAWL